MASSAKFEALIQENKKLKSEIQFLNEQIADKDNTWAVITEETKVTMDLTKTLCKDILGQASKISGLGSTKTWGDYDINTLIRMTMDAFKDYCKVRYTQLEAKVNENAKIGTELDKLKKQLKRYFLNLGLEGEELNQALTSFYNDGNFVKTIEKRRERKDEEVVQTYTDNDGLEIVEDEIMDEEEEAEFQEIVSAQAKEEISSVSLPRREKRERIKQKNKIRDKAIKDNLNKAKDITDTFTEIHWAIIETIGVTGCSRYVAMEEAVTQQYPDISKTGVRTATRELEIGKVLECEQISTPIAKKQFLYKFTNAGKAIFIEHFGGEPEVPEMDRVRAEHDNYEHGYGILEATNVLLEKRIYSSISSFNKAITLDDGRQYKPDIIGNTGTRKDYYEYERATHTQGDFNDKCDKMAKVTMFMNFIVPNQSSLKKLNDKVKKWIKTAKAKGADDVKINITTLEALKKGSLDDGSCWQIIYNLSVGNEPVKAPHFIDQ